MEPAKSKARRVVESLGSGVLSILAIPFGLFLMTLPIVLTVGAGVWTLRWMGVLPEEPRESPVSDAALASDFASLADALLMHAELDVSTRALVVGEAAGNADQWERILEGADDPETVFITVIAQLTAEWGPDEWAAASDARASGNPVERLQAILDRYHPDGVAPIRLARVRDL